MSVDKVHDWRKVKLMSPLTEELFHVIFTREGDDLEEKVQVGRVGELRDRLEELEAGVNRGPVEPVHETDTLADATKGEVKRPAPKSSTPKSSAKRKSSSKSTAKSKTAKKS